MGSVFPSVVGLCACGCGIRLSGRRRKWASTNCNDAAYVQFAILKGDGRVIRKELLIRDEGRCAYCGAFDPKWQADHIIPVKEGGSACGLDNFQTLCTSCHFRKTTYQTSIQWRRISLHEASTRFMVCLYADGEFENFPAKTSTEKQAAGMASNCVTSR
ncbi:MAG: HNH endonuclease [Flavobacteriales bacterium]|nr:HNH endonuclease [Flavobacteriales bacterium]